MASPLERLQRLVTPIHHFFLDWLRRIVGIAGVDRALAIGAQAFGALFPLLILYATLVPGQAGDLANALIERFDLSGSSAATVRNLFGASDDVTSDASAIGAVILIVSALSFTRALQRLYESAWGLEARGYWATGWGLLWLTGFVTYFSILSALNDAIDVPGLEPRRLARARRRALAGDSLPAVVEARLVAQARTQRAADGGSDDGHELRRGSSTCRR